jgi:(R,R)-butanediol dehydrogenase / meso-butanediol dehydrogenase / diacetyl reductase
MKAAVFKAPGAPLVIGDVPEPQPGSTDLILRVRACGICGTDLHWSESKDGGAGWRALEPETIMGHEFAGEVVEVGSGLRGQWKVGERATAQPFIGCGHCPDCLAGRAFRCPNGAMRASARLPGAYAEYTRVGASTTFRLPESVSFTEGALVEPLAVGLNAVRKARLEAGDTVLIVGAGPVGISVALWCRFFGARHIVISDLALGRAERAVDFGATAAIDASREDVPARVRQLTGGPPQVVFDCVGLPGSFQLAIDYAPHDARVVIVGLCMAADTFFPAKALTKELDLSFAFIYRRRDFEIVIDLLARERIEPGGMVTDHVGFDSFCAAFEALKRPSDQIKVMLEPGRGAANS